MQRFQEASDWTLCSSGWEAQAEVQPEGHSLFWPFCPNLGIDTVVSGANHKKLPSKDLEYTQAPLTPTATEPLGGREQKRERGLSTAMCIS